MSDIEKHQEIRQDALADVEDGNTLKGVDTVHQDEAMRVLAAYQGPEEWTEQEEKTVRRKIDLRLMPVLCMTYGLQYYDKAMLSQAVSVFPFSNQFLKTLIWVSRLCSDFVTTWDSAEATDTPCLQPSSTWGSS